MNNVMLAKPAELIQLRFMDRILVQPKIDGIRCQWNPASQELVSRNGNPFNLDHISRAIARSKLARIPLDGELYNPQFTLAEIQSAVKCGSTELKFHVFDIPAFGYDAYQRNDLLRIMDHEPIPGLLRVATEYLARGNKVADFYQQYLDMGFEGIIARPADAFYWPGRGGGLYKVKPILDAEYELVDVLSDTTIMLKAKRKQFRVSGMSNDQVSECLQAGPGAMVTVKADAIPRSGAPRYPRYKGVRYVS